jgi:hypothetical protein
MSKLKQLIGLQSSNLSVRVMGRALRLSVGTVSKYLRAVRAGWCKTNRSHVVLRVPEAGRTKLRARFETRDYCSLRHSECRITRPSVG